MASAMKRTGIVVAVLVALIVAVLGGGYLWMQRALTGPTPETIAAASLQGLREQNRLSAFAARFVAVVTSTQTRFGLSAKKTLILPGTVQYQVDLARLTPNDVRWDAATKTLAVTLPPVEVSQPEIDLRAVREYDSGGLLMALTSAETVLDSANRAAAVAELNQQARASVTMRLAQDATRRAVASTFAMPLRAAGLDAKVVVRFAGEPDGTRSMVDGSTPISEIYKR
ncbi:MAG: DUF4230 domain-containing protein [Sphingomonadaceae bacterium]